MKKTGDKVSSGKILEIFSSNGYSVEFYETARLSVAWKIYEEKNYFVFDVIVFGTASLEKVKEESDNLSKFSSVLLNEFINSPNISGLELKRVFGLDAFHYMGRQVIIVANKLLVSESNEKGYPNSNLVSVSDLSSVLQDRKDYVLKRASRIFRPNKGEVLRKAYSRARKGLILTIVLMLLLVPLIFLNETGVIFQTLLIFDMVAMLATIAASLVVHELGVANFKKLLKEERTAFEEELIRVYPQTISRTFETSKDSTKKHAKPVHTSQILINKETPKEVEIEKYVEPLLSEEGDSSEFYAQRRDGLWNLAQISYEEGEWDNCAYHLRGAVISALKEVYVKLTGKAAFGSLIQVAEFVCEKTGLDLKAFQRFLEEINAPQRIGEENLSRLFEQAKKHLTDLQLSMSATASKMGSSKNEEEGEGRLRRETPVSNFVSYPQGEKNSSKVVRGSKKKKTEKGKPVSRRSEKLITELETPKSSVVKTEVEVTNCDSVIETMYADDDIKKEVRELFDSRGKKGDAVFLVVTQSPEVISIVKNLKSKYPEVPLEIYEHAVNGKAQIIVSKDGEISNKIDYESSSQLGKLIRNHYREKTSSKITQTSESLDITDFLGE